MVDTVETVESLRRAFFASGLLGSLRLLAPFRGFGDMAAVSLIRFSSVLLPLARVRCIAWLYTTRTRNAVMREQLGCRRGAATTSRSTGWLKVAWWQRHEAKGVHACTLYQDYSSIIC